MTLKVIMQDFPAKVQTDLSNNRMHMAYKEWVPFGGGNCFIPIYVSFSVGLKLLQEENCSSGSNFFIFENRSHFERVMPSKEANRPRLQRAVLGCKQAVVVLP